MQAFSITLLATTGDPEGIRHISKSNWSGCGVVFTRELFRQLKQEPGFDQAGLYILVGNATEETIYIGEADPVGDRLKSHLLNKKDWVWGVYFFDRNHNIGKTEVKYLESALIELAKKHRRAILLNKNNSAAPSMAKAAEAAARAFLADMLLILPMLGINAFTTPKQENPNPQVQPVGTSDDKFDTIVIPAREEGFKKCFLNENCWFAVRINEKHRSKLKFIAGYQVAPIAAITHIAEIKSIEKFDDDGRCIIKFKEKATAIFPIQRSENSKVNMQRPRYALRDKINSAKTLDQVWK